MDKETTKKAEFSVAGVLIFAVVATALWMVIKEAREAARIPPGPNQVEMQEVDELPAVDHAPDGKPPMEGNFGWNPDPQATERFIQSLEEPTFREAAPHLFNARGPPEAGDAEPVLLYRYLYKAHEEKYGRPWICPKEGIGDCVSFGWGQGGDVLSAIDYAEGRAGDWKLIATEPIYGGSRVEARGRPEGGGGWSDGSYGAAAAKWVQNYGILWRQPYDGVDLTTYSSQRAKQWGNFGCGGDGDKGKLDAIAKEHPVQTVALVTTADELAAAIKNGYPVPVCSNQGFRSERDQHGEAAAAGSWAHCMVFIGYRPDLTSEGGPPEGFLCLNSWGPNWISGPKWPEDQPDGSFWVSRATAQSMLSKWRDSFAISSFKGFPRQKLEHAKGW